MRKAVALSAAAFALASANAQASTALPACPDLSGSYQSTDPDGSRNLITLKQTGCSRIEFTHELKGAGPSEVNRETWLMDGKCHAIASQEGICATHSFEGGQLVNRAFLKIQGQPAPFLRYVQKLGFGAQRTALLSEARVFDLGGGDLSPEQVVYRRR